MKPLRRLTNLLAACAVAAAAFGQPALAAELAQDPFITDNARRQHYEPGGKYHLFGDPRGSVSDRTGKINVIQDYTHQMGNLLIQQANINGTIGYHTRFSGHGHEEHAPFDNHAAERASKENGSVNEGFTVYRLNWEGHEHHPADAYDGPKGSGYPDPTGARDEYTYHVNGTARSIKLNPTDTRSIRQRLSDNYSNLGSNFSDRADEANRKMFEHNAKLDRRGNSMEFINGVAAGALNPFISASEALGIGDVLYGAGYAVDKAAMRNIAPLPAEGKFAAIGGLGNVAGFEKNTREAVDGWIWDNPNAAETVEALVNVLPFAKVAKLAKVAKAAKAAKLAKAAKQGKAAVSGDFSAAIQAKYTSQTAKNIIAADRIGSGLKADTSHRAASFLSQEQLVAGRTFSITGNDGIQRTLLQTKGSLNGQSGIYEYIIDSNNKVTHQRFIKGGEITGQPNQRVKTK
ncbi:MafB family polymorphic toxin [Neisseria lactamica]|uniref:MafB family polymorphic toxin n=1 Tax=Neisseria lactamica TaxID=486 RepID=UPI0003139BCE